MDKLAFLAAFMTLKNIHRISALRLTVVLCSSKICGLIFGGIPERSKGADCKSAGSTFGGSNPPPSTRNFTGAGRVNRLCSGQSLSDREGLNR